MLYLLLSRVSPAVLPLRHSLSKVGVNASEGSHDEVADGADVFRGHHVLSIGSLAGGHLLVELMRDGWCFWHKVVAVVLLLLVAVEAVVVVVVE